MYENNIYIKYKIYICMKISIASEKHIHHMNEHRKTIK